MVRPYRSFMVRPQYVAYCAPVGFPEDEIIRSNVPTSNGSNAYADARFTQQNIGVNSTQDLVSFKCSQVPSDSMMAVLPIPVHITEFGNIGNYISGNFSGTLTSFFNPQLTYTVTCNFRAKRYYWCLWWKEIKRLNYFIFLCFNFSNNIWCFYRGLCRRQRLYNKTRAYF